MAYYWKDPVRAQLREQILENCRWLFGQEVQLVIFYDTFTPSSNLNVYKRVAIILPKLCSLKSLTQGDINEKILLKAEYESTIWTTAGSIIDTLYLKTEANIGNILNASDGLLRINRLAIPTECNITDDTPVEPVETPTADSAYQTAETETEAITLEEEDKQEGTTANKELRAIGVEAHDSPDEKTKMEKKRIWRVVAYTPSGEPCIEEHEPSTDPSLVNNHPPRYIFTPGTSVVSDSGTITAPVDEHSDCTNKLEEASKHIERLEQKLLNLAINEENRFDDLQRKYLALETTSTEQAEQIKKYKAKGEKVEAVIAAMENEMIDLENSLREAQSARDAEIRLRTETQAQLKRERWRAARAEE